MSLKILYSDRIDSLASDLKQRLLQDTSDPFVFRQVVVPNGNLAKWLQMRAFADEPSLCAGIDFPFLDVFFQRVLLEALPGNGQAAGPSRPDSVAGAIASVLLSDSSPVLAPLRLYVDPDAVSRPCHVQTENTARKLWQLSAKLARLFSEYELRRPEIISFWLGTVPRPAGNTPTAMEKAEATLYRAVYGPKGLLTVAEDVSSLRALFEKVKPAPPVGPGRTFYFFGHSSLSPLHADLLQWLARIHDVVFYHLTVCMEYWGDVMTPWERVKEADVSSFEGENPGKGKNDLKIENELLSAWGRAGRSTMRLLVDTEEAAEMRKICVDLDAAATLPAPAASDSVLAIAQSGVRCRTSALPRRSQDASIQVVACQGIRREVEMVYNAILSAVLDPAEAGATGKRPWGPCDFSDIAVLVPDMATYRPMIEAVFDARGQIPYGLIDATASQSSRFLQGVLDLFRLAENGLDRTTLFAVLENPCVQRALRFGPDQVRDWRKRVDELGAFRSFDDADGAARGFAPARNFTWDYALSRLRLGAVADHLPAIDPVGDGEADDLRLSEIVELLYRRLSPLRDRVLPFAPSATTVPPERGWIDEVVSVTDRFLAPDPDDSLEAGVRRDLLASVRSLSIVEGRHSLSLLVQFIEQFIGAAPCRRGGYLTSGVTIASLQPMRPVPFKQVFILGLGETTFPGMVTDSSLDLRGLEARLGDARMPDINRYLFLETFMATRDRLVLSYLSKDIKKDADLFPSTVIRDLIQFLDGYVLPDKEPFQCVELPLLESDCRCTGEIRWEADDFAAGVLPTYRKSAREAECIRQGVAPCPAALIVPVAGKAGSLAPSSDEMAISVLARFMDRPLKTVLAKRFGVAVEGYQDATIADCEPLALPGGKPWWDLEARLFDRWLQADPEPDEAELEKICENELLALQKNGRIPEGDLGVCEVQRILEHGQAKALYSKLFTKTGLHETAMISTLRELHVRYPVSVTRNGVAGTIALQDDFDYYFSGANAKDGIDTMFVMRRFEWQMNQPPPIACARPFLTWLAWRASGEGAPSLRIKLLDVRGRGIMDFLWREISRDAAAEALRRLLQDWLDYPASSAPSGQLPDFEYKNLQRKWTAPVGGKPDWNRLSADLAGVGSDFTFQSDFNNDLVIQSVADGLSRSPDGGEMEKIYENRYQLFFTGVQEDR